MERQRAELARRRRAVQGRPRAVGLLLAATLIGGCVAVPDAETDVRPPRELADDDSRFVEIDGVDVHYKVAGEGPTTVLLLHHFFGNTETWRHVRRGLSGSDVRVVAFDRPAFGLTERPPRSTWQDGINPYTRGFSAHLGVRLLDHLGVDEAVVVGSSAGGTIALETYARHPDRVRALALMSPAITGDVGAPPGLRPALRAAGLGTVAPWVIQRLAGEITLDRVAGSWADPSRATEEDVAAYRRPLQVEGWARGFWELFVAEDPPDLRDVLPRIGVPTRVITGDQDRVISPRASRRTADAIPGAEFVVIDGCGHTPHEECPDDLVEVLRGFLDELS